MAPDDFTLILCLLMLLRIKRKISLTYPRDFNIIDIIFQFKLALVMPEVGVEKGGSFSSSQYPSQHGNTSTLAFC